MPKVSVFKNVESPTDPKNLELEEYLEKTRDGEWEDIVNQCRLIKDKEERDAFKRKMPTTTLSGTFSYRNDSSLIEHSGYLNIDLDHIANISSVRKKLISDRYVYSVFLSTSGDGLRVLFKIEPNKHREAFKAISQYLWDVYSLPSDPNGVSPSKPYIVSFDPNIYINYDDVPVFKKYIKEVPVKQINNFVHTSNDFENILKQITGRNINICESYEDWLKVGFAISEQFGEDGRFYFHEVSRMSPKYSSRVCDYQYTRCLKARGSSKVNISSFYYLAKINGIDISSEHTKKVVRIVRNSKKAGLSKETIIKNLKEFDGIEGVDDIVDQVINNSKIQDEDDEDSFLSQLEIFISNNYSLKMNEVTGYLENNGKRLTELDLNSMFISAKKLFPKLDYNTMFRLLKSDFVESYNPFFLFFESDGIPVHLPAIPVTNKGFKSPLIDKLASSIKNSEPAYTSYFLRKWIVGIISSAHKVHSPLILCLAGPQNTGKTEFFRRLLPFPLSDYYAESKLDKEKDDEILMTENLLVVDDEFGGKSKKDSKKLKDYTSKQWFSLRRPYASQNEKILRIAVLGGTSNELEGILVDYTGNRRVIVIEVDDIDKEIYNSIDKKELFIEAYNLYKSSFDWRITYKDIDFLNKNKERYEQVIKERDLIKKYFEPRDVVRLSTTEIIIEIEILTKQRLSTNAVGRELKELGFQKKSTREGPYNSSLKWCVARVNRHSEIYNNSSGQTSIDENGFNPIVDDKDKF